MSSGTTANPSVSGVPVPAGDLFPGDTFEVQSPWFGNYTRRFDARSSKKLTIQIVASGAYLAFSPAVITGSPNQTIHLTVHQFDDGSAQFHHNFSIDALHVDRDIPTGPFHHISLAITLPASGVLTFYCKYHVARDGQAGVFVIK